MATLPTDTNALLKQSQAMLDQTKVEGAKAFADSSYSKPIDANALSNTPDFKTSPPKVETQSDGLLGAIDQGVSDYTANLGKQKKDAETALQDPKKRFQDFSAQLRGQTDLTDQAYSQKGGVDEIQVELNDINQQIRVEKNSLQRKLEKLDANAGGGSRQTVEGEKGALQRESAKYQADLYVIQQGVQGKFDSAKAIADRAVSAYMEKQKLEYDALKFDYEENKELFTLAEQREFESSQADRKRALDREEAEMKTVSDLSIDALQNGAPTSVVAQMRQAKTTTDAIKIGGSYVGAQDRLMKSLQMENLRSEINKRDMEMADAGADGIKRTQSEWAALGFGERMLTASLKIDEYAKDFSGVGAALGGYLPNLLKSTERQQFEQSERNYINATLRRESGATISPEEFANAKQQYIPQPGDSAETLVLKKINRDTVTKNFLKEGKYDTSAQDASLNDPLGLGVSAQTANPLNL